MRNPHYEDHERLIENLVDDPIRTHSNSAQTTQLALQRFANERVFGKPVDGRNHSRAFGYWDAGQFLRRAALNLN